MTKKITDIFSRDKAALAPLAGITDSVYRRICREFGASPTMTEMVSADGLVHRTGGQKTVRLLRYQESERPLGFQLFGANPEIFTEAVHKALPMKPDFIDINAGCPVKKVVAKGGGSALLTDLPLLGKIVANTVAASTVPVTVKIRSGWDFDTINAVETARLCEEKGAAAVIVHPRTRSQGFSGKADWSIIRDVKEAISLPVIGSGDIVTPGDAVDMLDQTGCDAVMVGRRSMGNPWIFREVNAKLAGKIVPPSPGVSERLDLALVQLQTIADEVSEIFAVLNMRKFFGWYSKGARNGATFRQEVFRAQTIEEVRAVVTEFQKKPIEMDENDIDNHEMVES